MEKAITFTVAVPSYKGKYLKQCIESIIQQSYTQWELIVLDDDSPEQLYNLVYDYLTDKRINYIKNNTNVGALHVVDNWNKCLSLAHGEYFLCIGDDDILPPKSLEVYTNIIKKYPLCDAIHGRTMIIDENSKPSDIQYRKPELQSSMEIIMDLFRGDRQFVGDWLYKTETIRKIGGYIRKPYAWTSDHLTAITIGKLHGVANTQQIAFLYRENSQSITSDSSITKEKINVINEYQQWLSDFFSKKIEESEDQFVRDILYRELPSYIGKLQAFIIGCEISKSKISIFYWITHRHQYNISLNYLLRAFLLGIKMR